MAQGRVRRQHLRPYRRPDRLLPARPDADPRPAHRRDHRLRRAAEAMDRGKNARLARPLAPPVQGLRGTARGLRSDGHPRHDPPDAPPPRAPKPKALASALTFKTGSKAGGKLNRTGLTASAPPRRWTYIPPSEEESTPVALTGG